MSMQPETRQCLNCSTTFTVEPEDFDFYAKLKVPPPSWCPRCRYIRRLCFINERAIYKGTCGNCNKAIITMYKPGTEFPSWCVKCHLSDKWDARDYGRDYDFTRPFFEQFRELKYSMPHRALDQNERNGEGCEYANLCFTSKNIYLAFDVIGSEYIKYSDHVLKQNKNCMDSMLIRANDRGYELVQSTENYNSSFLLNSDQCVESHFLYNSSNCVNCCLSSNLRNKSYVFRNKQLTREQYFEALADLHLESYTGQQKAKQEFQEIFEKTIHRFAQIKNCVNSTGDYLENCKNLKQCYAMVKSENVKYSFMGTNTTTDSQDLTLFGRLSECYELTSSGRQGYRVVFSLSCGGGSKNLFYCDYTRTSSDCFGCVNLLNQKYCILNKQYSKEEYFEILPKIIKHMDEMPYIDGQGKKYGFGEFFPPDLSPFAYNETDAFTEEPLSKEEAVLKGYKWLDMGEKQYVPTIASVDLPDSIYDVPDTLTNEVIECPNKGQVSTQCASAYKILPDELQFYRQMRLPVPRYCPNCRYHQRLIWKNKFKFYERECMCGLAGSPQATTDHSHVGKCKNSFTTMYAPERPETIYCKDCYQKEVY